ncbi:MAG TPA: DUF3866 family protein [Solirubrobacteraceae bacterium]|nr:DUF3866 family protein [Solirubrobacteraceae bacterium]
MLKLRRATVVETRHAHDAKPAARRPADATAAELEAEQRLVVELAAVGGVSAGQDAAPARREAIADVALVGHAQVGDEVIVNTQALDLGLGSGGFDVVHVNLTRGLAGEAAQSHGDDAANVMKLNYTSLQHAVVPVEGAGGGSLALPIERPTAVLALHGQLAAFAFAFAQGAPGARLGFVQTEGGALPGGHSRTVRALRERGLLAGHVTAGAAFGGEGEAMTTAGALQHGLGVLGWDAAVCGPGPGIVGSGTPLGHGGMVALDSAHVALALGCPTLLVARMSSGDERSRHRGLSHHSLTVLDLLLEPVTVALPAGMRSPVGADLRAGLQSAFRSGGTMPSESSGGQQALALQVEQTGPARPARIARHDWRRARVDLPAYASSGLPAQTMGRTLADDPLFFAAALAGGSVLAELAAELSEAVAQEA